MAVNLHKLQLDFRVTDGNRKVSVIRLFIDKNNILR